MDKSDPFLMQKKTIYLNLYFENFKLLTFSMLVVQLSHTAQFSIDADIYVF